MASMQRVAELSHVKAPTAPPSAFAGRTGGVRVAWHGGKISSNKEEALRKFLERKQRAGDQDALEQIRATQSKLGISLEGGDRTHKSVARSDAKNPKKLHATHRPHAKVQESSAHKTIVINGRVVGPKVSAKKLNNKLQRSRPAHVVVKMAAGKRGGKSGKSAAGSADRIALEKRLDLPLDELVKRGRS